MNGRQKPEGERRRLSALGVVTLALVLLSVGLIGWAWLTYKPAPGPTPKSQEAAVALPPPVAPTQPESPKVAPAPSVEAAGTPPPAATPATPAPTPAPKTAEPAPAPAQAPEPQASATPPKEEPKPVPPPPAPKATPEPKPKPAAPPPERAKAKPPTQLAVIPGPLPELLEQGKNGPLPRIAPDGRMPWRVYARPFDANDTRPRVVIVIGNLGLSSAATEAAIQELPGGVTLSFSPYSHRLDQYIPLARAAGHEVLLSLPMEPVLYPTNDPGPRALLTALTPSENLERLTWQLSRFAGYAGVTNYMGSRFTTSDRDIRPILEEIRKRGLLFFDSRSAAHSVAGHIASQIGVPTASNERFIDNPAARGAIDQALKAVEDEARQKGVSIAMGFPYPVTIERVAAWAKTLPDKGIVLAPVSAAVREKKGS